MTQEISSLMDGELEAPEAERAIRSCCTSREAAHTWQAYHLIGDALRGDARPSSVAERVGRALAQEPAIVARPKRVLETTLGRVAFAAAASVATVGIVGWIGTQGGQVPDSGPVVARNPTVIQPVAHTTPAAAPKAAATAPAPDLQDYLAAHRQIPSPDLYRPVNNRVAPAAAR